MNGGTASAQMECVSDISKHLTDGDFAKAERIFNRLVRNGASGLQSRYTTNVDIETSQIIPARPQPRDQDGEIVSDPASEAMRAADALDFQTASLQPNNEIDLTNTTRSRSTSVPPYRAVDDFQNATPFYVFGARKWQRRNTHNSDSSQTPRRSHTTADLRKTTQRVLEPAGSRTKEPDNQPGSPYSPEEERRKSKPSPASLDLSSPRSFKLESIPNTPSICEAFAVQVRPPATTTSHKKIKPVDRIYSSAIRNQDILLCSFPEPPRSRPQSLDVSQGVRQDKLTPRSKFTTEIPRPTFSTPKRSIVRRNPPSPLRLQKVSLRPMTYVDRGTNPRNSYVDRGTTTESELTGRISKSDTRDSISLYIETPAEADPHETYEPILPMVENLVIFFKSEKSDPRLEATIQSFREGKYPMSKSPSEPEAERISQQSSLSSQQDLESTTSDNKRHSHVQHEEAVPACHADSDDYDPFAYEKYPQPSRTWPFKPDVSNHRPSTPPTPAQTPPLAMGNPEKHFHDFTTTNCRTAVCMQNSLRSILNIYFPPEDAGYHQFNFPLLPELSSLWKPVFREADAGTVVQQQQQRRRKVDLILGIGAQQGVDREFLGAISGSLEKLGTKPNGVSRSGSETLDEVPHRKRHASFHRTAPNQPNPGQPLFQPPPPSHADHPPPRDVHGRALRNAVPPPRVPPRAPIHRASPPALSRRRPAQSSRDPALGSHLAATIPRLQSAARTAAHPRTDSGPGILRSTTRSGATLLAPTPTRAKRRETPSFAKANFLLTSSANESEIATLISTIWKILIDISAFYIPEGMAAVSSRASMHADRDAKRDANSHSQGRPLAQTPLINTSQQPASLTSASAIMGFRRQCIGGDDDAAAEYNSSQRNKLRNILGREPDTHGGVDEDKDEVWDWESCWDEEDARLAAEARKYMPLYGRRGGPRKGSSRKALKWLGLAT
ncbi:gastric mucin-like protein [Daldinia childiae]|uniref:gastric mucin-like protein n=1 Tax=Daldinia childiae TaxID=326645 RepID=UPI00144694F6|nr:gastric mucin-like protein [Daldinia childiae]KAF3070425.1 gastric mucin-like protein [Daldinia childiae]